MKTINSSHKANHSIFCCERIYRVPNCILLRAILIFCMVISIIGPGYSQKIEGGMSFGINQSKFNGEWNKFVIDLDRELRSEGLFVNLCSKPRYGVNIGGYINIELTDWLLLQSEINYINQGASMKGSCNIYGYDVNLKMSYNLNYLHIPLLIKLTENSSGLYIIGGPYASVKTHANLNVRVWIPYLDSESEKESISALFKNGDYGYTAGVGCIANDINLEIRYSRGYNQVLKADDYLLTNSMLEIKLIVPF